MQLELESHTSLELVREFLAGSPGKGVLVPGRKEAYGHVERVLRRFSYWKLGKADKGLVRRYLQVTTGRSRAQVTRLIGRYLKEGRLETGWRRPARPFRKVYGRADIVALAEMDEAHGTLSGPATRRLLWRAWAVYGDPRYERLARISNGHLYNLRKTRAYELKVLRAARTKPRRVAIGERRKPAPQGRPGWIRVDTVHQGDRNKVKGVYHLNLVDEVTQWQVVTTVERISEGYLVPAVERALESFPFVVRGFHSDNGSEYVNWRVAGMLEKLRIEFTKSRPRRCNDNGLAETKNGSVVRRMYGREHVPRRHAGRMERFNREVLVPYLNYHRPCQYASAEQDAQGKVRKRYRQADVMTPLERLKSLEGAAGHLREGVDFERLEAEAGARTDLEAGRRVQEGLADLFEQIRAAERAAI